VSVRKETPIPKDFQKFLRNDKNKTELFQLLADSMCEIPHPVIVSTKLNHVVSNLMTSLDQMDPCNHEEADTRMFVHIKDGVDTDVVIIALYHFFSLNIEELWIEFGTGKYRRQVVCITKLSLIYY